MSSFSCSFFFKQALQKFQKTQQVTNKSGIEQEDALLNESAAMETSLNLQILELESETKQLRHELERVTNERDRMLQENSEIGRDKSGAEAERARLKAELKDMKYRETRMLSDYSELEEENISLQKQVSSLRSSQVRRGFGGGSLGKGLFFLKWDLKSRTVSRS